MFSSTTDILTLKIDDNLDIISEMKYQNCDIALTGLNYYFIDLKFIWKSEETQKSRQTE